jgi:predicted RNase H-like HicB family nuclease
MGFARIALNVKLASTQAHGIMRHKEVRPMKHELHFVIERDEEGWLVGSVPSLPGCHTQARSMDELNERMQEAIEAYLGAQSEDAAVNEFVGVQKIRVDV